MPSPAYSLPNASSAIIDIAKLRDYCLNPLHPEGRHKARVFATALGIVRKDAEWLRTAILVAIQKAMVIYSENTPFGCRYTVDIELKRENTMVMVRTAWIIRIGEDVPRLVTCFVL
ncbi:MAG: hypothetical protein EPN21_18625 [Methylococcaceae bacterium]|nr:MAG: hypothetical protein EPN21_18625 [Methylococcaceae bacterium]